MKRTLWILGMAFVVAGAVFAFSLALGLHANASTGCTSTSCNSPDICYFADSAASYCALPVGGSATCAYGCCSNADCGTGVNSECYNHGTSFSYCGPQTSAGTTPTTTPPPTTTSPTTTAPPTTTTTGSTGGTSGLCITAAVPAAGSNVGGDPFYTQVENACWQEFGGTYAQCVANGTAGTTGCTYTNQALAFNCGMPESGGGTAGYCQAGGPTNCITPMTNAQKAAALGNEVCTTGGQAGNQLNGPVYGTTGSSSTTVITSCVSDLAAPTAPASGASAAALSQYVTQACASYYGPTATACESNPLWLSGGVCTHYTEPQLAYNCGEPLMGASEYTAATYPSMTQAQMAAALEPLVLSSYVSTGCAELFNPQVTACSANEAAGTCTYSNPQLAYNCDEPLGGAGSDEGLLGTDANPTMTLSQMAAALEASSCSGSTNTGANGSGGTGATTSGVTSQSPSTSASIIAAELNPFAQALGNLQTYLNNGGSINSTQSNTSNSSLNSSMQSLCTSLGY